MNIEVPGELSILGFDDYQTRFMANPVYTSICQDAYQLGYDAGSALLQVLAKKNTAPIEITREAVFEVHETTGAPRS